MKLKHRHLVLFLALLATLLVAGCVDQLPDQLSSVTDGNGESDTGNDNTQTNGNDMTNGGDDGENIVRYSSSGFEPRRIHISQGESVTWVRDGGPDMWVASDVHPAHRAYDGTSRSDHCGNGGNPFDQCGTGDRFTFAFNKAGSWGYHNHNRAAHSGTVIVE